MKLFPRSECHVWIFRIIESKHIHFLLHRFLLFLFLILIYLLLVNITLFHRCRLAHRALNCRRNISLLTLILYDNILPIPISLKVRLISLYLRLPITNFRNCILCFWAWPPWWLNPNPIHIVTIFVLIITVVNIFFWILFAHNPFLL